MGNYDVAILAKQWDDNSCIRDRIRENQHLLRHYSVEDQKETDGYVEGCVDDARVNKEVLAPVFSLMKDNALLLPSIDRLILTIEHFYQIGKKPKSMVHCYQMAWATRRAIQAVKSLAYKDGPPEECFNIPKGFCHSDIGNDFLTIYILLCAKHIYDMAMRNQNQFKSIYQRRQVSIPNNHEMRTTIQHPYGLAPNLFLLSSMPQPLQDEDMKYLLRCMGFDCRPEVLGRILIFDLHFNHVGMNFHTSRRSILVGIEHCKKIMIHNRDSTQKNVYIYLSLLYKT